MLPTDGGPHIQEYVPAIEGRRNDTEGEVLALRPALPFATPHYLTGVF